MNEEQIRNLLEEVRDGSRGVDAAVGELRRLPFEDLGFAKVDHHRALRHGMPEVILGLGKTVDEVRSIAEKLLERSPNLLVTRAGEAMFDAVRGLDGKAEFFSAVVGNSGLGGSADSRQGEDRGRVRGHERHSGRRGSAGYRRGDGQ